MPTGIEPRWPPFDPGQDEVALGIRADRAEPERVLHRGMDGADREALRKRPMSPPYRSRSMPATLFQQRSAMA